MKKIEWTTGDGRSAVVTVTLKTERLIGHDDFIGDIKKPCCEISVSATVDGKDMGGLGNVTKINHPVAVAAVGKLAMTQENADRVYSAISEFENSEYAQNWRKKEMIARAELKDYEAHCDKMHAMMNDGGIKCTKLYTQNM